MFAPPCSHTITALGDDTGHSGVHTFRYRQSSEPRAAASWFHFASICAQEGPKSEASRIPLQDLTSAGSRHRKSPTGGAANGRPRNAAPSGFGNSSPRTSPPIIDITGPVAGACAKTDAQAIRPKQSPTKKVYSCFVIASSRDKFVTSSVSGSEPLHGPNSLSRHNCSCPSYKPWLKCARGPGPESSRF